jgi:hypothetical protein
VGGKRTENIYLKTFTKKEMIMLTTITKHKAVPLVLIVTLLSFLLYSPIIPTVKASDEYDALRAKWHNMLVGDSTYSTTDPDNAAQITSITTTANSNWSTLLTAADRTSLWSDLTDWTVSSTITSSYSRSDMQHEAPLYMAAVL